MFVIKISQFGHVYWARVVICAKSVESTWLKSAGLRNRSQTDERDLKYSCGYQTMSRGSSSLVSFSFLYQKDCRPSSQELQREELYSLE